MIDVIIPVYNSNIELLLMSLVLQSINDKLNITIVDDCSKTDYTDVIDYYSNYLNITYIRNKENVGAGLSRQIGIDNTSNPYIMFIDSDDLLYNSDSINELFSRIPNYDIVSSLEYDEYNNIVNINDNTIHGKMYKREYLNKYNIRFNESRYHEDNYFNNLVLLNNPRDLELLIITYIYRYNKKSLTHDNVDELYKIELLLKNMGELLNKKYDFNRLSKYLREKFDYLNRLYASLDKDKKKILLGWIDKYLYDYKNLLNTYDLDERINLLLNNNE